MNGATCEKATKSLTMLKSLNLHKSAPGDGSQDKKSKKRVKLDTKNRQASSPLLSYNSETQEKISNIQIIFSFSEYVHENSVTNLMKPLLRVFLNISKAPSGADMLLQEMKRIDRSSRKKAIFNAPTLSEGGKALSTVAKQRSSLNVSEDSSYLLNFILPIKFPCGNYEVCI